MAIKIFTPINFQVSKKFVRCGGSPPFFMTSPADRLSPGLLLLAWSIGIGHDLIRNDDRADIQFISRQLIEGFQAVAAGQEDADIVTMLEPDRLWISGR